MSEYTVLRARSWRRIVGGAVALASAFVLSAASAPLADAPVADAVMRGDSARVRLLNRVRGDDAKQRGDASS